MHEPEQFAGYTLTGKGEILEKLRLLEKRRILLTATVSEGKDGFLTTLLKILPDKGLMVVDASADERLNKAFLAAEKVFFSATVDGIQTRFTATGLKSAVLDGQPVFALPLPDHLFWLQRRRYYRVDVPLALDMRCHIPLSEEKTAVLEVLDLSLEGVAVLDRGAQLPSDLAVGTCFTDCHLLPQLADEPLTLEVRDTRMITLGPSGKPALRVGCCIRGASRSYQVKIQKLLYELEIQRKRLTG